MIKGKMGENYSYNFGKSNVESKILYHYLCINIFISSYLYHHLYIIIFILNK
ncbi:hypothetical protein PFFCH_05256 [Plasmodium falciparum FCH/4]|uniref:Uncharacterized protein n=1 Tax=Plasmodium falciparum FCH/4 TaxID=1036724 RepID=A0A024VGL0_PLAFA|nr:hypothetical protein PFFCH_05256 [Plasmodium falciparum FCH/4]